MEPPLVLDSERQSWRFGVRLLILGFGRVWFFGVAFCQTLPDVRRVHVRRSFFHPYCCAFLCCEFCVGFGVGWSTTLPTFVAVRRGHRFRLCRGGDGDASATGVAIFLYHVRVCFVLLYFLDRRFPHPPSRTTITSTFSRRRRGVGEAGGREDAILSHAARSPPPPSFDLWRPLFSVGPLLGRFGRGQGAAGSCHDTQMTTVHLLLVFFGHIICMLRVVVVSAANGVSHGEV